MPTGRLALRRIRDVLRLKFAQGLSERAIAASVGIGKGSVGTYLRRARNAGLRWPLPVGLDDDSLELLLFPSSPSVPDPDRPVPDWSAMDKELRKRSVTQMLLWEEYRAQHPGGFGYTWFCTHSDAWNGRVLPSMRQKHAGGETVFGDYAGDTIDIVDPDTGEVHAAKLLPRKGWKTGSVPIPADAYVFARWERTRIATDYHVEVDRLDAACRHQGAVGILPRKKTERGGNRHTARLEKASLRNVGPILSGNLKARKLDFDLWRL